jgi:hypothetical protein
MARFKRIGLGAQAKAAVVEALRVSNDVVVQVNIAYDFGTPEYVAASEARAAARRLATALTGDENILLPKPHSSPPRG